MNPRKAKPDVTFLDPVYLLGIKGPGGKWLMPPGQYHTGIDLNGPNGGDTDLGQPVYAIDDGQVVWANLLPGAWGRGVVIRHTTSDGGFYYSRSMHLNEINIAQFEWVKAGQRIGTVGKGAHNMFTAHLHFDVMVKTPPNSTNGQVNWGLWPGSNLAMVKEYFTDPWAFLKANSPVNPPFWGGK